MTSNKHKFPIYVFGCSVVSTLNNRFSGQCSREKLVLKVVVIFTYRLWGCACDVYGTRVEEYMGGEWCKKESRNYGLYGLLPCNI